MKDLALPLLILGGIITIALTGGIKNASVVSNQNGSTIPPPSERQLSQDEIAWNVQNTQYQTQQLQQQVAAQVEAKNSSQYKGKVTMLWGTYGTTDPDQEYIEIDANYSNTSPVDISGWTLTSTSTNQKVVIPQSTALYFANGTNSNSEILLRPGERAFIVTGKSPLSYGMHVNICSGYLARGTNFIPSLYTSCPAAQDEPGITSIPRTPNNNNCFDLINSIGSCQNGPTLNNTYSYECQQFVETKLNYQTCVDTHKNDSNFYSPNEWYVYLNRSQVLWQPRRETVILTDMSGKPVAKMSR